MYTEAAPVPEFVNLWQAYTDIETVARVPVYALPAAHFIFLDKR